MSKKMIRLVCLIVILLSSLPTWAQDDKEEKIPLYYDDETDIVIDRYSQTGNRFSGIFCDARTYEDVASFRLIKTSDNRYWAPTRSANPAPADSIKGPRK